MTKQIKVAITGLGVITPLGDSPSAVFQALAEKKCAIKPWKYLADAGFKQTYAARVEQINSESLELENQCRRGYILAEFAAKSALQDAQIREKNVGVFVGTCMGESAVFEAAATQTEIDAYQGLGNYYAHHLQQTFTFNGPTRTYGCACASGNYAIGAAAQLIRNGLQNTILAGGVEAFSRIAYLGFSRMRAMASDRCKPFDANRDGMSLSEAAAFLVLENEDMAKKRGANIYGYVNSLGLSCDGYHTTAPRKDGSGMAKSMLNALALAKITESEIDWVCAHGTGTLLSDIAESHALKTVFGENCPPVSSIKGAIGHSLGAASAVEAVITTLSLYQKQIPPTVGLQSLDSNINLDVVQELRTVDNMKYAFNCSYGFGGMNSTLLMERP